MLNYVMKKVLGTKNDRELKKLRPLVGRVAELEPRMKALADDEFPRLVGRWKGEVAAGRPVDELMPEVFALVREAGVRALGMRHFDVQLIGGAVLHAGKIAEMKTGEGKTLVATLPCVLNALSGRGVHVVTVNDYLARRDAEWMGQLYRFCGLASGVVVHGLTDAERQAAYGADITYGQNNEFGFDYLRDNMKFRLQDYVQRELHFAIVDEVDSILIDEARTPLIISGPSDEATDLYYKVNAVIPSMIRDADFTVDEKTRTVVMTDAGVEKIERRLGVANLYDPGEIETLHHVEQALRAHHLYRNEVDYVVKEGEVIIVDEFTGRLMAGRRWSDGLHQAVEAKEGVKIEAENQTLATISFQNYFRMYSKLSGMTGTADTEAEEFAKIYDLDVVVVPTNQVNVRRDAEDVVYRTEGEKFEALCGEIQQRHEKGQPVLVGTVSVAKSEVVSTLLKRRGVPHAVLNAKHHGREAEIVAQAGRRGMVTIATNMAGRGTDILLGGNAEFMARQELVKGGRARAVSVAEGAINPMAPHGFLRFYYQGQEFEVSEQEWGEVFGRHAESAQQEHDEVIKVGGLFILGTERHESRRIDNQLRGRAGRQGDPGESRFYLSLEDDLMRIFAKQWVSTLLERLGMEEGVPIESKMISKRIEGAQKAVEAQNFESRKHLLEYDDVMNKQREIIYADRRAILEGTFDSRSFMLQSLSAKINESIEQNVAENAHPGDWDLPEVLNELEIIFPIKQSVTIEELSRHDREGIRRLLDQRAVEAYEKKEAEVGPDMMRIVEQRFLLLPIIDRQWVDHLYVMDHLKNGIGLRGYGQIDPRVEYEKEAFEIFEDLKNNIADEAIKALFHVQIEYGEEQAGGAPISLQGAQGEAEGGHLSERDVEALLGPMPGGPRPERELRTNMAGEEPAKPRHRDQPKVGRNDLCPCGSGKKYKKCHGAPGAAALS